MSLALLKLDGGDGSKAQAALDRAVRKPSDETALPELGRELRGLETAGRDTQTLTTHAVLAPETLAMTTFLRTFPLNRLAAVTAALGLLAASPLCAAEQNANYEIHFGVKAGVDLGASFKLRPTVQQPLYVWVLNNSDKDAEDVTVEVLADGAPVDGTVQHVAVKAKSKTQVVFGKPLAAAAPPPAPPAVPAPPAKPQPPALQEAKGALQVAVLDAAGKEKLVTADLPLARPEDYVQVTDISYNPEAKGGDPKNTLTVKVKASAASAARRRASIWCCVPTASPD